MNHDMSVCLVRRLFHYTVDTFNAVQNYVGIVATHDAEITLLNYYIK